jgi:fructose-1,6-bisphosphatase/inositol monophosphatase family enzyme
MEIRKVQKSRDDSSKLLQVELKDAEDPRSALTEADHAAQKAIVGALRQEWGLELCIVGEEDGYDGLNKAPSSNSFKPLKKDMFEDDIGETAEIDPSEITIYVDPLDGTREFVEERLENCQVLVGIAIGGESVAGAIGYVLFPK